MWKRENVLSYAARIKEISDKIEDAYRLNNNFRQKLERDVIQCFIRSLCSALRRNRNTDYLNHVDNMGRGCIGAEGIKKK